MASTRRWSVERHINNMHEGDAQAMPFVDYLKAHPDIYKISSYTYKADPSTKKDRTVIEMSYSQLTGDQGWEERTKALVKRVIKVYPETTIQLKGYPYTISYVPGPVSDDGKEEPVIIGYQGFVCPECLSACILELFLNVTTRTSHFRHHNCNRKDYFALLAAPPEHKQAVKSHFYKDELPKMMVILSRVLEETFGSRCNFAQKISDATTDDNIVDIHLETTLAQGRDWLYSLMLANSYIEPNDQELFDFFILSSFRTYALFRMNRLMEKPVFHKVGLNVDSKFQ
jgi:hypothetical protein